MNSQVGLFCLPYRKSKILNQVPLSSQTLSTTGHEVNKDYKKKQLARSSHKKKKKHFIGCAILHIHQSVSLLEQISGIIWKQTSEKSTVYYPVAVRYRAVLFKLNWLVWGLGEKPGALAFIHGWYSPPDALNGPRAFASVSHPRRAFTHHSWGWIRPRWGSLLVPPGS